jgi:hypothetical protein
MSRRGTKKIKKSNQRFKRVSHFLSGAKIPALSLHGWSLSGRFQPAGPAFSPEGRFALCRDGQPDLSILSSRLFRQFI